MGACRANELHHMNLEDIQDLDSSYLVTVPKTKTKIIRRFLIADRYYEICKNYIKLRPDNVPTNPCF